METGNIRVYQLRYVVKAAISHQPLQPLDLILIKFTREAVSHPRKLSRKESKSFLTFILCVPAWCHQKLKRSSVWRRRRRRQSIRCVSHIVNQDGKKK